MGHDGSTSYDRRESTHVLDISTRWTDADPASRQVHQLRTRDLVLFNMKQLSVTQTCDTHQIGPTESLYGPLDPDMSCRTSETLPTFSSDSNQQTEASEGNAGASKVSSDPEATASEAGSDDDPFVPKTRRCFRHEVSFQNSWHHRKWKVDHRICDTCLKTAADSLGTGHEYEEQIDISARSRPQVD